MKPKYKKLADIIKPLAAPLEKNAIAPVAPLPLRRRSRPLIIATGVLVIILVAGAGYLTIVAELRAAFISAKKDIASNMHEVAAALQTLNIGKAKTSLANIARELESVQSLAQRIGLFRMFTLGGKLFPVLNAIPGAFDDFVTFSGAALGVSEELETLQKLAFQLMFNGGGEELIRRLENLDRELTIMLALANRLQTSATMARVNFPSDYLTLIVELYRHQALLKGVREFLGAQTPTNIALLFQNPSEMRPTGGFIGSYGVVTITNGNITNIEVRDIYDPDGQLDEDVLPPRPLQAITGRWGARDANWFFDFPTSAAKVLSFLEKSKIYSERGVRFAGTIAINIYLIEDILRIVGPIELTEYNKTVTNENVLAAIQEEVEAGEDKRNGKPKRILSVLTPLLLQKLADATDEQKRALADALRIHARAKDILVYANDRALEAYLQNSGLGGELYVSDGKNAEDYLAVVNANIAGGKSDAFMNESVLLESRVDLEGKIANRLTITREHAGTNQDAWWYRAPNKNFIQLFVPNESRLRALIGSDGKTPDPPLVRPTYARDADIQTIEQSMRWLPEFKAQQYAQFGKTTFATWFTVKKGERKTLVADYELPRRLILADGIGYRFVFERQSGTKTRFSYRVEAPPGFIWKESSATSYAFETESPEARIVLDVTLAKL